MSQQIYLANDKYRAALRANWIDDPPDGSLLVSAVPDNVPTLVVVGWQTDFETVFSVQGKAGHDFETYALTGVSRLRGYDGVIPENTTVNCLNNEEFMNQYLTFLGIEWKGEWDGGVTYVANDGVSYEGSSYISKVADNTNHVVTDTDYWQLVTLRGASWSHGAGAPDNGNGIEGDFYLNTTNDDVYVKGASTWSLLVNIKGEQGIQGIQGETGATGSLDAASSVTLTEIETPANPDAGKLKIYAKDDGKVYKLNAAGEEVEIGAGGGADVLSVQVFS